MSGPHNLVEIPPKEWKVLLDLYGNRREESNGYFGIKSLIECSEKGSNFDIKCFALDNDWKNDGTYLMIVSYKNMKLYFINYKIFQYNKVNYDGKFKDIFFNTLSDNLERLTDALCYLAPDPNYELFGYSERLVPAVDVYINKFDKGQREIMKTYWYKANKEMIANFSTE